MQEPAIWVRDSEWRLLNSLQNDGRQYCCRSELDVGTTFTVTIPFELDSNYKEAYALENVDFSKSLSGLKVLLVEDNELNMEIAKFILENAELESITMRKEVRD